jgi:Carboxypeptidase regulatory-like domain
MTYPKVFSSRSCRIAEPCSPRFFILRYEGQPRHQSQLARRASVPEGRLGVRAVFPVVLILLFTLAAHAQDKKGEIQLRTVHGAVLDKDENPVPSSVVYLKNVKSQAIKTYIADDTGHYRFSGLDPNVDYEVHAEHNDLMSSTRTVSSFDSRRDIDVPLKLNRKKPAR